MDAANKAQNVQEDIFREAQTNVETYLPQLKGKVEFIRDFSFNAVKRFEDCSFEYVYVDAVHDYEGALADMIDYWPKLKPGGVMAGHDYLQVIIEVRFLTRRMGMPYYLPCEAVWAAARV